MSATVSNWIEQLSGGLFQGLQAAVYYPLDPSKRVFWLFILSSALFALLALRLQRKRITWLRLRKTFFSRTYWLSASTLTDLGYLLGNSALRMGLIVPLLGSHLLATLWVARQLQATFGNAPAVELPWLMIATVYTLIFFVVEDLSRYLLHRFMHQSPLLWYFHRVHHSAHVLTPLTLHRVHPVEMLLFLFRGTAVFGVVSGVFVYLFGTRLSGLDILGVDLLGFMFNLFAANLRHSHIWLSFGPLERWLVSPAQHQLHHSSAPEHRNKNFGASLAVWDRWFDSWIAAGQRKKLNFGLGTPPAKPLKPAASGSQIISDNSQAA